LSDGSLVREGGSGGGVVGRGVIETKTKSKSNNKMLVINCTQSFSRSLTSQFKL